MTARPTASVLVADDRPENVLALQQILEPLEYQVVGACSGEEVLRALLHQSPRNFGKKRSTWTLQLLADTCSELGIVDGKVSHEDPVTKLIPQLNKLMVVAENDDPHLLLKPLVRPVT